MKPDKENIIVSKSLMFAVEVLRFAEKLETEHKYIIARQIIKSGTAIGANVSEAQNAESKQDFIHKMKIAAKEAEETDYWMQLCKLANNYPYDESVHNLLLELLRILSKILSTSKQQLRDGQNNTSLKK
jgi:four helix bundle protein